jgi:anaerobic magnesium-protoporphyrin IX monomethyl ester cyclase
MPAAQTTKSLAALLVAPDYPSSPFAGHSLPVGLGYLAEQLDTRGITYAAVDVSLQGEDALFRALADHQPASAAFSLMSLDIAHNYALIGRVRARFPGIRIVIGGPHVSFVKAKVLDECPAIDCAIEHEGEYAFADLLAGAPSERIPGLIWRDASGRPRRNGPPPFIADLDTLPFPRYRKFDLAPYGRTLPLVSSRGCPFACTFCGAFISMGHQWRARSPASMVEEIAYWHGRGYRTFNFVDSNFFLSRDRVLAFCDALEARGLDVSITSDGMRAHDADETMLRRMKRFGLQRVAIGVESANDDILRNVRKGETVAQIEEGIRRLGRLDITVIAFFIIGLPGETVRHVLRSLLFSFRFRNIESAYYFNPNPLVGTALYAWAHERGYLRASEADLYRNIGGMGQRPLIATPELSFAQRRLLYSAGRLVSLLIRLRYHARRVLGLTATRSARGDNACAAGARLPPPTDPA